MSTPRPEHDMLVFDPRERAALLAGLRLLQSIILFAFSDIAGQGTCRGAPGAVTWRV